MKTKTKNRIWATLRALAMIFVGIVIAFTFWLTVGVYGQMKYQQGFLNGFNAVPAVKTSYILP